LYIRSLVCSFVICNRKITSFFQSVTAKTAKSSVKPTLPPIEILTTLKKKENKKFNKEDVQQTRFAQK
jgi:hypothetical protein